MNIFYTPSWLFVLSNQVNRCSDIMFLTSIIVDRNEYDTHMPTIAVSHIVQLFQDTNQLVSSDVCRRVRVYFWKFPIVRAYENLKMYSRILCISVFESCVRIPHNFRSLLKPKPKNKWLKCYQKTFYYIIIIIAPQIPMEVFARWLNNPNANLEVHVDCLQTVNIRQ